MLSRDTHICVRAGAQINQHRIAIHIKSRARKRLGVGITGRHVSCRTTTYAWVPFPGSFCHASHAGCCCKDVLVDRTFKDVGTRRTLGAGIAAVDAPAASTAKTGTTINSLTNWLKSLSAQVLAVSNRFTS